MAKRTFSNVSWTPGAGVANGTTTNAPIMALKGGSSTQLIDMLEVMIEGQSGASSPTFLIWARDSTIGVTPTALADPAHDGPMHPSTAALAAPPVTYTTASTLPTRSSTTSDAQLTFNLNTFGGIIRWAASPYQQWSILGNTAQLGESSLSAFTGGTIGSVSSHIIYEPY